MRIMHDDSGGLLGSFVKPCAGSERLTSACHRALRLGSGFEEVGGLGNAFAGWGHPGGEFAGSAAVVRRENPA